MQKQLKNKVALITGGSRGIGAGIVKRLAREGADVAFTHSGGNPEKAKDVLEIVKESGQKGIEIVADSGNPREITAAINKTIEKMGRLDILVNNAGVFSMKPFPEYSLEEFDDMVAVNVKAVFVASQAAVKHMSRGGRIIHIGSNMADRVTGVGGSLYSMSKSALSGLTRGMARDLGAQGITVNLVQPGPIDTDMNPADSDFAPMLISQMALPHYGHVDDIAGLVAYLAGEESRFITGTAITIDGGFSV